MRNFNGDNQSGWKPKKRSFGFRDSNGPELFEADCSECGESCEVPFKPNGRKPVFCRDCFKKNQSEENFGFDRREERPFRERSFKTAPIQKDNTKEQFEMLNMKLDYILKALSLLGANKLTPAEKTAIETQSTPAEAETPAPKVKKRLKLKKVG